MKHHYWEAPIVIYLFLGGLGGGIFFLSALFDLIIAPGSGPLFFAPVFFALAALAASSSSSSWDSRRCSGACSPPRPPSSSGARCSCPLP